MSVPSIYSVEPTGGQTSGRERVKIIGNFFRLPTTPDPANGPTTGDLPNTVQVTFDGIDADAVAVLDIETIIVITPEYYGDPDDLPKTVDIVVQNLDDDGVPIAGESYTLADGFTYSRPDITEQSGLQWLTRQLIIKLKRNVLNNVAISASPDWTDSPAQIIAAVSSLPVLLVEGPNVEINKFYSYSDEQEYEYESGTAYNVNPFVCDFAWTLTIVARRKTECLNLTDEIIRYFRRRPIFKFPTSPIDSTILEAKVYLENFRMSDRLQDQVFTAESEIKIEGIQLDDSLGMPADESVIAYEIETIELDFVEIEI